MPGLKKADFNKYKDLLLERRSMLVKDEASVQSSSIRDSDSESRLPDDLAERSSEAYDIDFAFSRMESVEEEIKLIDEALEMIVEKTYGDCVDCSKPIPKKRLQALPYVKRCVACKEKYEDAV